MCPEITSKTRTKAEVIELLANHTEGMPLNLMKKLLQLTAVSEIPHVDSQNLVLPDNCLVFSTADNELSVYFSQIDGIDLVICMFDRMGNSDSFIGIGVSDDWKKLYAIDQNPEKCELSINHDYVPGFATKVRKIDEIIQFGRVSQGGKEL